MRIRIGSVLVVAALALVLSGCGFDNVTSAPTPGTNAQAPTSGAPRANFTPPPNFTPGGQRPGAQRTPQATTAASSATNAPTRVAPTAVAGSVVTTTRGTSPTAVPIPQVIIPTAAPSSLQGGTPTPLPNFIPAGSPNKPPAPTAVPSTVSIDALRGKIVFRSDRGGPYLQLYVMEADGSNPRLCNCSELWEALTTNETYSPDKNQFLFVKTVGSGRLGGGDMQIWAHNVEANADVPIAGEAPGFPGVDYDPVWSPDARYIAWVSEVDGNDEIYVHDGVTNSNYRLTQNTWEFDKHPSFSPDGSQIVFWSNRESGTKQIWVMNLDGSNQRNLSSNQYNDSDPLWVK